ncbi:MAG: hypothetical protein AB4426_27360 [Xenococcaceae cyanobacterium]
MTPELTHQTYENIQQSPKAYMTINGANHYGITNVEQPASGPLEINQPTLVQNLAIETIARLCGLFLRAYALDEPTALDYLSISGDSLDENVNVIIE